SHSARFGSFPAGIGPPVTTAIAPVSARDTTGVVLDVLLPLAARGLIVRRPRVVGALDRIDADLRAIRRMQSIRERYAPGPVLLRVPGRGIALIVSGAQVRTVLYGSPAPFATANREKRAALSRFEPHGVLISRGAAREARRDLNEQALDTGRPVHRLGGQLVAKV